MTQFVSECQTSVRTKDAKNQTRPDSFVEAGQSGPLPTK